MKHAFTLIELLIVIALLAAIAMIIIPNFTGNKQEVTETIIQSELAEIQRAFFRFKNDCVLKPEDYQTVAKYGVAVLMKQCDGLESWNNDRQRGWRGSYLQQEDTRNIDPNSKGQQNGDIEVPVICCSENNSGTPSDYYRILATDSAGVILSPSEITDSNVHQLWAVYPYSGYQTTPFSSIKNENKKYYRQLLEEEVTEFNPPKK
jgi:prepilin-type N-terminal cleavage/methylation domain-containing protein